MSCPRPPSAVESGPAARPLILDRPAGQADPAWPVRAQELAGCQVSATAVSHPDGYPRLAPGLVSVTGEITELTLLTVVGLCRAMRDMPDDVWAPADAARAFAGWPVNTFDVDEP